jgi:hypothetical protein
VPLEAWEGLKAELCETGDWEAVDRAAAPAPEAPLAARQAEIDAHFAGNALRDILNVLRPAGTEFAEDTLAAMAKNSPLSMACAVDLIRRARGPRHDRGRAGAGIPLHRAGDGAWRFPRRHPRRDHRQGQDAALAA